MQRMKLSKLNTITGETLSFQPKYVVYEPKEGPAKAKEVKGIFKQQ